MYRHICIALSSIFLINAHFLIKYNIKARDDHHRKEVYFNNLYMVFPEYIRY